MARSSSKAEKFIPCSWIKYISKKEDNNKQYLVCSKCGRIKREDLPDTQPCSGSKNSRKIMIQKIMGFDISDNEIKRISDENEREEIEAE